MAITWDQQHPEEEPDLDGLLLPQIEIPTIHNRPLRRIQRNIRVPLNDWLTPQNPEDTRWICYWEPLFSDPTKVRRVIQFLHKDVETEHQKRKINKHGTNSYYIVLPKEFLRIPEQANFASFRDSGTPHKYYVLIKELTHEID